MGAVLEPPTGEEIVDLNRAFALKLAVEDAGAPEAEADSRLPSAPLDFLRAFDDARAAANDALEFVRAFRHRYDGPDLRALGVIEPRAQVRIHAPVPRPGKVIGVARNYLAHAEEMGGSKAPEEPVLFIKASSAVIGPEDEIQLPAASRQVDFEGELAVVVGRTARSISAADALATWRAIARPMTCRPGTTRACAGSISSASPWTASRPWAPPSSRPTRCPTPRIWPCAPRSRASSSNRRAPRR